MPAIYIAIDLSIKDIFNTYALKRYVWFLLPRSPPYPTAFFVSVEKIASRHHDQFTHEGKPINASFEGFKGKDTSFESEWLRQKLGLEKLES